MTLHLSPEEIIARNKAKQRQWRIDHPDRVKQFNAKYNAKPEVTIRKAVWAREHKDEINTRRREIYRLKRETITNLQKPEIDTPQKCIHNQFQPIETDPILTQ